MRKKEQKKKQKEDYTYAFIVIFLFFVSVILSPNFSKLLEVGIGNMILDVLNLK